MRDARRILARRDNDAITSDAARVVPAATSSTLACVDDELVQVAREAIGAHFGLSAPQAARLHGSTRNEIEVDARAMRRELGLPDLDEGRDEHGRYKTREGKSVMDAAIRQAAGR